MKWEDGKKGYENYLTLEKALSLNSIAAYINDINKLVVFLENKFKKIAPEKVKLLHLKNFVEWLNERDVSPRTQARTISGIKSFYKYLLLKEELLQIQLLCWNHQKSEESFLIFCRWRK